MLDLIVLGYIPGTTYQLKFDDFFAFTAIIGGVPIVMLLARTLTRRYSEQTLNAKLLFVNLYRYAIVPSSK